MEIKANTSSANSSAAADWFTPWRFAALLAGLFVVFFPGVLSGSQTFFYRDYGVLGYPFIYFHHETFWHGEMPFWNPLSNCGAPFLAQWGTMTLYPLSLIYLLLPLPWSLSLFCFLHLMLAGVGMYFLARRWTGNNLAASFAGIAYACNGLTLSSLMWPNYTVALGWMPWVVLLVERAWREGGRMIFYAALVAALQMLSGVPEIILLTWFILTLMLVGEAITGKLSRVRLIGSFALIIVLVSGLSAVQLLPFMELLAHSQRDSAFATAKWAMPAWGWGNLIVPLLHYFTTPEGTMFQTGQAFVASYFPGLTTLALAAASVLWLRRKRVWLLLAITLAGLVLALGDHGFIYTALRQMIPVLGLGRYPIKFAYLATFALPLLGAFAVARHVALAPEQRRSEQTRQLYLGIGLTICAAVVLAIAHENPMTYDRWSVTFSNALARLVFLGLALWLLAIPLFHAQPEMARLAGIGLLLVVGVDLLVHLPQQNPRVAANLMEPNAVRQHLSLNPAPAAGESRILISNAAEDKLLELGDADIARPFLTRRLGLWSNLNILDGMPKVNGSSTLQAHEQSEVQNLIYKNNTNDYPRLYDFLSVSYEGYPADPIHWTKRDSWLPMITFGQAPIFADKNETLAKLTSADFNPATQVYLPLETKSSISVSAPASGKILSKKFSNNRIELEIDAQQKGLLVIAQTYYPAWHAYIDGQLVSLLRANHAFQAVEIPQGHHQVVIKYEDKQFQLGAIVSALTLTAISIGMVGLKRK